MNVEDIFDDLDLDGADDDFEPIAMAEADRIIAELHRVMESTANQSIQSILEDACCEIASLIPDDDVDAEAA